MYGAGAKGDGADTFSEQHGSIYMCDASKLPIGPLFEKIALSKFILTVTGHKRSLSEGLAGPQVFYHTNRSRAGTFLHLKIVLLQPGGTINFAWSLSVSKHGKNPFGISFIK